jgi:hypothetical protein
MNKSMKKIDSVKTKKEFFKNSSNETILVLPILFLFPNYIMVPICSMSVFMYCHFVPDNNQATYRWMKYSFCLHGIHGKYSGKKCS